MMMMMMMMIINDDDDDDDDIFVVWYCIAFIIITIILMIDVLMKWIFHVFTTLGCVFNVWSWGHSICFIIGHGYRECKYTIVDVFLISYIMMVLMTTTTMMILMNCMIWSLWNTLLLLLFNTLGWYQQQLNNWSFRWIKYCIYQWWW